jgi:hypothetical protein
MGAILFDVAQNYGKIDNLLISFVPIIIYSNAEAEKSKILSENKGRAAINILDPYFVAGSPRGILRLALLRVKKIGWRVQIIFLLYILKIPLY